VLAGVRSTSGRPDIAMPGKTCGTPAATIASIAVPIALSGRFFIPTGIDRPDANWRCTWLSTVRAPMAPQRNPQPYGLRPTAA
jgi:hypothetical protein